MSLNIMSARLLVHELIYHLGCRWLPYRPSLHSKVASPSAALSARCTSTMSVNSWDVYDGLQPVPNYSRHSFCG